MNAHFLLNLVSVSLLKKRGEIISRERAKSSRHNTWLWATEIWDFQRDLVAPLWPLRNEIVVFDV